MAVVVGLVTNLFFSVHLLPASCVFLLLLFCVGIHRKHPTHCSALLAPRRPAPSGASCRDPLGLGPSGPIQPIRAHPGPCGPMLAHAEPMRAHAGPCGSTRGPCGPMLGPCGPMRAHAGPCGPSQHRELACRSLRSAPAAYYLEAHEARRRGKRQSRCNTQTPTGAGCGMSSTRCVVRS
jgi:hypothetical protein